MPAGRPTIYTSELGDKICSRIAEGETVLSISRDPEMPHSSTIYDWAYSNEEFSDKYAKARERQAEHYFDEIVEIADEKHNDVSYDDEGNARPNGEVVNRSRLRVDTRKWYLSKVLPKKFADKQYQDVTSDGEKIDGVVVLPQKDMGTTEETGSSTEEE